MSMNSEQIQEHIYQWASTKGFDAPYGVLTGQHTNARGQRYRSVTFGHVRTLDASVDIYNCNFMILRTSRRGSEVYKTIEELMTKLERYTHV